MEVQEKYANLIERTQKVALWEGQKYRMLSDTFDSNWKPGDEPHGEMTFTNVVSAPTPEDVIAQKRVLARETAIADIETNQTGAPWGVILKNMAIAQGWIKPE